jgi:alkylated DNA repair dioxygenase AlkB
MPSQPLLITENYFPSGFVYEPEFLSIDEERALLKEIRQIKLDKFEMHGQEARRMVRNFGLSYSSLRKTVHLSNKMPDFLLELRDKVGKAFRLKPQSFVQALITHYPIGAPIGWHSDKAVYKEVIGISLNSSTTMRLRKASDHDQILKAPLARRSAYLFSGVVRRQWEHHIPPAKSERYSITFRTIGK